jgi:hypothetical protein
MRDSLGPKSFSPPRRASLHEGHQRKYRMFARILHDLKQPGGQLKAEMDFHCVLIAKLKCPKSSQGKRWSPIQEKWWTGRV